MNTIYFLDFDGVLCDSILECFISSYIGYYHHFLKQRPVSVELERYAQFTKLRPFIRRGADYLLLHKMLDERQVCECQQDFDIILQENGKEISDTFHECFYLVREDLLSNQHDYWLSLNKIYAPLKTAIQKWALRPDQYILSTKKAEFIKEILIFSGIDWPLDRIIYSGTFEKNDIIVKKIQTSSAEKAFFIDDQIDHFKGINDPRIETAIAAWGYIQQDWLEGKKIPVYQFNDLIDRLGA